MALTIKEACPACRYVSGVPLFFGLPGPVAYEAEQRGELVLGGTVPMYDQGGKLFNLACRRCAHHWYAPDFDTEEDGTEEDEINVFP